MKKRDRFPSNLTDEERAEYDELWEQYFAGPADDTIVTFTAKSAVIHEWLFNKYCAYYDLSAFVGSRTDKNFSREESISREVFAAALTLYAKKYLLKRLDDIINASVKGLVTELHESQRLIVEAALGLKKQGQLYPHLLSGKRLDEIWLSIIREHLDPKFVKGRGGKKPKADLTRLHEKYNYVLSDWSEASELFQAFSKSRSADRRDKWRKEIYGRFKSFPLDLIERLQPMADWPELIQKFCSEKGGEDKPEDIALEHAARLCGANRYSYMLSTLRQKYNQQKREKVETKI